MNKSNIKKFRRITLIVLASIIGLIVLVYGLLWLPPVQQKIKDIALKEVMKITKNQITIGNLSFRPFNKITVDDVYANDLRGDTLVRIHTLSAEFDLWKIFNNELLIKGIQLDGFIVNVKQDSIGADFNFQFLIDAFASDQEPDTTSSSMKIEIHDIAVRNGSINYDILSEPTVNTDELDYNHIHLSGLTADIDLSSIDIESLDVTLRHFAVREKSGFSIENAKLKVQSEGEKILIKDVLLALPNSELSLPEARIDYTGHTLDSLLQYASYSLKLGDNFISPADIQMFYLPADGLKGQIKFTGSMEGTFPSININEFKASYGGGLHIDMNASITDFTDWERSAFQLRIADASITTRSMDEILAFLSEEEPLELPVNTGDIRIEGKIAGNLPNFSVDIAASTDRGNLSLTGNGGYLFNTEATLFDIELLTENFDLNTLMADTIFGVADVRLVARGNLSPKSTHAEAEFNINRFDFNRYTYHNIDGRGLYVGDSVYLKVDSRDENIPVRLDARGNIGKSNPSAQLQIRMDSIYIDTLNFLPAYKDTYLSSVISASVTGFDPELMDFKLDINDFKLYTDKGSFIEPHLQIEYVSDKERKKNFSVSSRLVKGGGQGAFTYAGLQESIMDAFPVLFEGVKRNPRKKDNFPQDLKFRIDLRDVNSLSQLLEIETELPDSAIFMGQYTNKEENLELLLSAYTEYLEADTIQVSMLASNRDNNLSLILNVDNRSKQFDVDGSLDAEIQFIPVKGQAVPDMDIQFNPTMFLVNDTFFDIHESSVEVREKRYAINDFMIDHGENEYIKVDGIISENPEDSIRVNISQFEIGTILGAMKTTNIPISGTADGELVAKKLLASPSVLTRGFNINNIVFAQNDIGNLNIVSGYSTQRQAIGLQIGLSHPNREKSEITGFYLPERDSLSFTGKIRDIDLKWLDTMTEGMLYGLDGSFNVDIKAYGKSANPIINGYAYFDQAKVGIKMLNVLYTTSDSIFINPNQIDIRKFRVFDENKQPLVVNGSVKHKQFSNFSPDISIFSNNFMVMNNSNQTDSLFFGKLRMNSRLKISENANKEWILSGDISHADNSKLMINMPTSASTAQRHTSITFVNSEGEDLDALAREEQQLEAMSEFSFPIRMNITLNLTPGLTAGIIYNPASGDSAEVNGTGVITVNYDLASSLMTLNGDYTVNSGKATLSVANVAKKTFNVAEGGKVSFRGDPLAVTFDVTALYSLRADLATLDEGFSSIMATTRVPVTCSISASGSMDKMNITYDILLPNENEETQRKMEGVLYTDDDKIIQIAYLLALGRFMPPDPSNMMAGGNMTGSLASMGLNALFSGMFNDNWSVNTNINTDDTGLSDMDVNVSTSLLDNRLTVTGTVGYSNEGTSQNTISGDFAAEYKLIPSGNLVLRVYHKTNNQYFERAPTTQGIGLVYKRAEKTFNELFQNILGKSGKPQNDSMGTPPERPQHPKKNDE